MKKHFITSVFFLVVGIFNGYGQQDCSNALSVCSDANSDGLVFGYGRDDFQGFDVSGCLGSGGTSATTVEVNSYWFRVKLAESGEFGFTITPNDLSEDWDFAVYGPNDTCGALRDPVACNYIGTGGYTGVGVDPSGVKTNGYEDWLNVTAGQVYFVLINQYDGSNAGFSISWKGAVMSTFPDPLDCNILVELGPPRELCGGGATNLNVNTFISSAIYKWFKSNPLTGIFDPLPTPIMSPYQLYVNAEGRYRVEVVNGTTGSLLGQDEIDVIFREKPVANLVPNIITCDSDRNGFEEFDLNSKTLDIISGQIGMAVTYYKAKGFAENATSSISSPYTSNGETIWARIENTIKPDCYDLTSFDLVLTSPLIANKPPDLLECDDDNNGETIFNLESQTSIILGGQTGIVTYYRNEEDAKEPKGPISNTITYLSGTTTIWARVEPTLRSGCAAFTSFEIKVFVKAIANSATNILHCDFDNDGLYQFDLKALKDAEILGTQSLSTFEVSYYETQANANSNQNALPNPYTNVTPYAEERIFARIQNKGFADCFETTSFTLQVLDTPYPAVPANIPNLSYCDDNLDGNDTNGFIQFDLTERETIILNGQSPFVFDVNYFRDAAFTSQILNPTAFPNSVANQQTVYVRVTNSNSNNVDCDADTSFIVEVKPLPNALLTAYDLIQCDEDGTPDGLVDFNLSEADFFVTLGDNNLNVTYHLSATDAASGINVLNKSSFSNNISSAVFARVASSEGCYRIVQVNLTVSVTSFPPNYSREIIFCDDDASIDGLHEFNLAQVTSEIISQFPSPNLRVGYYRNQADAVSETNIISPANAYLSEVPFSQTIWVRVESAINGNCFGIGPVIQLTVNPRPEFDLDETDIICLNDLPKIISTRNPLGTYSYEWTDNAGIVISGQPFAEISQAGVYTVMATSNLNCVSFPKQITITESIIADISSEDIQIIDNSGNNSITINNANQNLGIGDYEFALDDISGPYQDDPVFSGVIPGTHIVFVRDKNNCGIAQITVYVFGFPNFFTPNDDGQNDTWNVLGVDPGVFKSSSIYIFDRYGKLMANFSAFQLGWDGFYNSHKAVSTDYWYLARMTDLNDETKEYKGHFSLIRR